jgi:hypothetical protein
MPIAFAEHQHPNQVHVVVTGETSMQDMMNFIMATRSGYQRKCAFLFDVSEATVNLSGDELRQLASYAAEQDRTTPMGPVAFISSEPGAFGAGRMYQSYSVAEGRKNVGVFRTMADAQAWLDKLNS